MFLVKFLTVKLLCIYLLCIYLHYIHICIYLLTTNKIEVSQKGPPLQNLIDLSAPLSTWKANICQDSQRRNIILIKTKTSWNHSESICSELLTAKKKWFCMRIYTPQKNRHLQNFSSDITIPLTKSSLCHYGWIIYIYVSGIISRVFHMPVYWFGYPN